jgi:S1-C subfamily serine protease
MELSAAIEQIRPAIVQISFRAYELDPGFAAQIGRPFFDQTLGTGFIINRDGDVITARHVIEGAHQLASQVSANQKQVTAGLAIPNHEDQYHNTFRGNFVSLSLDLVAEDEFHDLALLTLRPNPFEGQVRSGITLPYGELPVLYGDAVLHTDRPIEGAAVAISGYPLANTVLVTTSGAMATVWSVARSDIQPPGAPAGFFMSEIADVYLADVQANPGNSGGPVYLLDDASVVGVCVAGQQTNVMDQTSSPVDLYHDAGLTIVTPAQYVAKLLETNGRSWSRPGEQAEPKADAEATDRPQDR